MQNHIPLVQKRSLEKSENDFAGDKNLQDEFLIFNIFLVLGLLSLHYLGFLSTNVDTFVI